MKIAYLIHSLNVGGAEMITSEYLLKLKDMGHDVCLFELYHTESFLVDNLKKADVPIITLCKSNNNIINKVINKLFMNHIICKKLNKILNKEKFDILHIHTGLEYLKNIQFDMSKIFYSFHTNVRRNIKVSKKHHLKNMLNFAKKGMNFFVLSQEMLKEAQGCLPTDKIYVLPNGLDFEKIRSNTYKRREFLPLLNIPNDSFVVCHIARMHPVKNHLKTIEVFKEIVKKNSNSYLLLIGQPEQEILTNINNLISQYGLEDRVKILGNREDATAILSICDAMILPSKVEGFPLVALEAQVLGIRCVLTDAVPDEVVCNINCFKLNINEDNSVWANLLMNNNVRHEQYDIENLSIDSVMSKLSHFYIRSMDGELK